MVGAADSLAKRPSTPNQRMPAQGYWALDPDVWLEQTLTVASAIEAWCEQAIEMKRQQETDGLEQLVQPEVPR